MPCPYSALLAVFLKRSHHLGQQAANLARPASAQEQAQSACAFLISAFYVV